MCSVAAVSHAISVDFRSYLLLHVKRLSCLDGCKNKDFLHDKANMQIHIRANKYSPPHVVQLDNNDYNFNFFLESICRFKKELLIS